MKQYFDSKFGEFYIQYSNDFDSILIGLGFDFNLDVLKSSMEVEGFYYTEREFLAPLLDNSWVMIDPESLGIHSKMPVITNKDSDEEKFYIYKDYIEKSFLEDLLLGTDSEWVIVDVLSDANLQESVDTDMKVLDGIDFMILYNDDSFLISKLLTKDGIEFFSQGTKWGNISEDANVYVVIDKKSNKKWKFDLSNNEFVTANGNDLSPLYLKSKFNEGVIAELIKAGFVVFMLNQHKIALWFTADSTDSEYFEKNKDILSRLYITGNIIREELESNLDYYVETESDAEFIVDAICNNELTIKQNRARKYDVIVKMDSGDIVLENSESFLNTCVDWYQIIYDNVDFFLQDYSMVNGYTLDYSEVVSWLKSARIR